MRRGTALVSILAAAVFFSAAGCSTTDGSSGGWIVVDPPETSRPPDKRNGPPGEHRNKGQEVAAQNHIRSAYRFLEKGKPDHAMRELEKARSKGGENFWFHYYLGGAYYLKGMYSQANKSWEQAYRYTRDPRLRSRVRTCQSFAFYYEDGEGTTLSSLKEAVEFDRDNGKAVELLEEMKADDRSDGYDRSENSHKENRGKGNRDKGKKPQHGKKKFTEEGQFQGYFLIEMPE